MSDTRQEQCVQQLNRPSGGQMSPEIICNGATQKKTTKKKLFSLSGRVFSPSPTSVFSSVLLFDVQRKGRRRHQPVAAAAARHHGDAAPAVSVEAAASAAAGAGGRRGCGRGRGGLLELLLVDFALFGPTILEPDLHLEVRKSCFYLNWTGCTGQTSMLTAVTCLSDRLSAVASSDFLLMVMYLL